MSRLSALSIVLALAIGPDAAAICSAWCTEETAAAEYCDHGTPDSPLVAGGNCCADPAQDAVAVLQMAVRFDVSSANGVAAVLPVRNLFIDSGCAVRPDHVPGARAAVGGRPQITVLRI